MSLRGVSNRDLIPDVTRLRHEPTGAELVFFRRDGRCYVLAHAANGTDRGSYRYHVDDVGLPDRTAVS